MRPIEPGEFTTADLELLTDDGMRFELVDGQLIVTPPPPAIHQLTRLALCMQMLPTCPEHLELLLGMLEFRPTSRRALQPDLLVFRRGDAGPQWIEEPLLLAVEVHAPTTRMTDKLLKRSLYEQAGVDAYWMLDPDEVSLTVLELEDGRYVERAVICGDEVFEADRPFVVDLVPADLIRSGG